MIRHYENITRGCHWLWQDGRYSHSHNEGAYNPHRLSVGMRPIAHKRCEQPEAEGTWLVERVPVEWNGRRWHKISGEPLAHGSSPAYLGGMLVAMTNRAGEVVDNSPIDLHHATVSPDSRGAALWHADTACDASTGGERSLVSA